MNHSYYTQNSHPTHRTGYGPPPRPQAPQAVLYRTASPSADQILASMASSPANRIAVKVVLMVAVLALAIAVWPVTIGVFLVWCMAQLSYGAGKASRYRF